jgi:MFS family permease
MTFFLGLIPFFIVPDYAIWVMLIIFIISTSIQMVSGNIWVEWIAASFPLKIRARFFSIRQQYIMISGLITGYFFSLFIDLFDHNNVQGFIVAVRNQLPFNSFLVTDNLRYLFLLIFTFAVIMGLISLNILTRQPERRREPRTVDYRVLGTSLKDKNFRVLLLFSFWWMLAVGIGAPFWQPFMINNLQMSLIEIQFYGMISSLSSLIFLRFWGKIIDRWGNKTAMFFLIILGSLNPLIWLFANQSNLWLLYIEAFTSGMMWCGAGIVSFNFALAVAPIHLRQLYGAFYGAVGGIAMTITMLLSGRFYPAPLLLFGLNLAPEQVLFALTSLVRLSAIIPLLFVNEPKSRPILYSFSQLNQFAKVRVFRFSQWFFEKIKLNP